ncbi:MAG: phosphoglycerate dehydrogenase [Bdellovibrionota bacterium]
MTTRNDREKVAVCSRSFSQDPQLRRELLERYVHVTFNETGKSLAGEELVTFLRGHQKAIVALEAIDEGLLGKLPDLRVIGKYGVGMDKVDFEALARHGIRFGWTGGVNRRSVAELTIAFAISMLRGVTSAGLGVREGRWENFKGRELGSSTLGLVGCGHVGKEVAVLARAFGTRVLAHDLLDFEGFYNKHGIETATLEQLLSQSDVVSLHVPLTNETRSMISDRELESFKQGAYLINTARGGIVDEAALERSLSSGHLGGAAFDVFHIEPPIETSLIALKNFWATPHIGGSSKEAILAMGRAAISGLDEHRSAIEFISSPEVKK